MILNNPKTYVIVTDGDSIVLYKGANAAFRLDLNGVIHFDIDVFDGWKQFKRRKYTSIMNQGIEITEEEIAHMFLAEDEVLESIGEEDNEQDYDTP